MSDDLVINIQLGASVRQFFYSQLFITPTKPEYSFQGQTVIVTGSNVGLGFEAARHIYRLNAAKLILAVRTVKKGEAAKESIVKSVRHRTDGATAIEVWPLDLSSTPSTLAFAERVQSLDRVDVVVENAGINAIQFEQAEGFEQTIQVNVLNTLLLALCVLPKIRQTKKAFPDSTAHLEIVSSEVHRFTKAPELNAPDIYAHLNDKSAFNMGRYNLSKLLEILFIRELCSRLHDESVVITMVNPGLCKSELDRSASFILRLFITPLRMILARTTEVGSRTLVAGACSPDSHGQFMSDGVNQDPEAWILTDTGKKAQLKVFEQTMKILEQRKPGISKEAGL
ncbi:hypothetical protein B0A52_10309 [Exophiala mesophila]|uniref:Uncharacterized protein n=1 Tax=Exophiala mesophila TaxID=212818 RepID=A0A438MQH5_EXOME|nr:hypothetical protein B0A52_10309 [Exophiala mesophila]